MLQRDYFLRVIEEFGTALASALEKKKDEKKFDDEIRDLYRQYVGSYDVVRNLSFDEVLRYAHDNWKADEQLARLNMLAELLYAEGSAKGLALRSLLFEKAFRLYSYVEANGGEYSLDRQKKMQRIREEIKVEES